MTQNNSFPFLSNNKNERGGLGSLTSFEVSKSPAKQAHRNYAKTATVLVVVEGTNDIEFLRRISKVVVSIDPELPQLDEWEIDGRLIFLPFGGGSVSAWSSRLAPLKLPEFHLYDRETFPETSLREHSAQIVNTRPNCHAAVTQRRSLENYLHPSAINTIDGLIVKFGNHESVTEVVARSQFTRKYDSAGWELLPKRGRERWSRRTKHWLPPEFARAERFDAVVFVDLPTKQQREQIWELYLRHFSINDQVRPNDEQWTGAEIKACCRLAALLDVPLAAAAQNIVPVAVTAAESVSKLRTWASGRCLSADRPGVYQSSESASGTRRKLARDKVDPLQN